MLAARRLGAVVAYLACLGLAFASGSPGLAQSGQRTESLETAILEIWPDASQWTVEDVLIHHAHLDRAVRVSLPPHESEGRIDRYQAARCEHQVEPAGWSCRPPRVLLDIRPPEGVATCPEPARAIPSQPDLSEDLLLEVVDHARHDPSLEAALGGVCRETFLPRGMPFDESRCLVESVHRSEGQFSLHRPAGRGCSSVTTFERSCSDGQCTLRPVRCALVCA